jgi:Mn-dependent DtxR family transcriptional regulator
MLLSEVNILTFIDRNGRLNDYLRRSADVLSEYIIILFNSLRKRGFISGNRWTGFHLTEKGREYATRRPIYTKG